VAFSLRLERAISPIATGVVLFASMGLLPVCADEANAADSPFATSVVSYAAGIGAAAGYTNPLVTLGPPERFTGDGFSPQAVTPFQPAFLNSEIVSIGLGGSLVLAFDHVVTDDPRNPFGIDLLLFGNAFCADAIAPSGVIASMYSEGGAISLSVDGVAWTAVPAIAADGPFPTLGYSDVMPYATAPGRVPTDFTRPVDPGLAPQMIGMDWPSIIDAYDGSGGGVGIDLASLRLSGIRYVRIDGPSVFGISPEIDAIADVAPTAASADLDGDGIVSAADLAILLGAWGGSGGPADLDGDGDVDAGDLAILLGSWS
jgi:hypothetical protein